MKSLVRDAAIAVIGKEGFRNVVAIAKAPVFAWRSARWHRSQAGRHSTGRLRALHDRYRGRRAFVIGNGPSLNRQDLSLLRDEVTIGSNIIYHHRERMGFLPTFLTVEDRYVAEDKQADLRALTGTQKIYANDLIGVLDDGTDPIYVDFRRTFLGFPKFSTDCARHAYWGATVTFFNLELAFHLGCAPVYLIGCDHRFNLKGHEKRIGTTVLAGADEANHFVKGAYHRWFDADMNRMDRAFALARDVYEANGRAVFNATDGGYLEVFERIDYASLFGDDAAPATRGAQRPILLI